MPPPGPGPDQHRSDLQALRAELDATGGDGYQTLTSIPAARRLDIGVLDSDVFRTYIDRQPKNTAVLPLLSRLDKGLYSTKR